MSSLKSQRVHRRNLTRHTSTPEQSNATTSPTTTSDRHHSSSSSSSRYFNNNNNNNNNNRSPSSYNNYTYDGVDSPSSQTHDNNYSAYDYDNRYSSPLVDNTSSNYRSPIATTTTAKYNNASTAAHLVTPPTPHHSPPIIGRQQNESSSSSSPTIMSTPIQRVIRHISHNSSSNSADKYKSQQRRNSKNHHHHQRRHNRKRSGSGNMIYDDYSDSPLVVSGISPSYNSQTPLETSTSSESNTSSEALPAAATAARSSTPTSLSGMSSSSTTTTPYHRRQSRHTSSSLTSSSHNTPSLSSRHHHHHHHHRRHHHHQRRRQNNHNSPSHNTNATNNAIKTTIHTVATDVLLRIIHTRERVIWIMALLLVMITTIVMTSLATSSRVALLTSHDLILPMDDTTVLLRRASVVVAPPPQQQQRPPAPFPRVFFLRNSYNPTTKLHSSTLSSAGHPYLPPLSHHPFINLDPHPTIISDNTQLYPLLDSADDPPELSHMEYRKPLVSDECVPMAEWQTTFHPSCNVLHEYDLGGVGEGSVLFGTKGFWRHAWWRVREVGGEREKIVLKTLKPQHNFEDAFFEFDRIDAISLERLTSSPHVIDIFSFCGHSVITEYADGPRLGSLADKNRRHPEIILGIAASIAEGLADVHGIDYPDGSNATFVHLDINPANVVGVDGQLKLNDFNIGVLRRWNVTKGGEGKACGFPAKFPNPQWRSPEEALNSQHLTEKVDVFSLGHIFFRLICGHEPWNKLEPNGRPSKDQITKLVQNGTLPHIPTSVMTNNDMAVRAIREAMLDCYTFDPVKRPSARSVADRLKGVLRVLEGKKGGSGGGGGSKME